MTEREILEALAKGYHDLHDLQQRQKATTALALRACIARLQSPNSKLRREAIDGLTALADLLEGKTDGS